MTQGDRMPSLRVLIAEDEYVSATLLEYVVGEEGHEVCAIVSRGADVLDAVREHEPDVVLMDVRLADDTSGIAATRELVRQVHVPVIVISATEDGDELRAIAESGALGYIKKPISPDELRVSLRIAVHHNAVMRRLRDSEFLHRSLFDNAAVGIYLASKDGLFLASNRAYARMLGYSGPAELLLAVRSIDEQIYVEPGRRAELLVHLAQGVELSDMESRVYGRDGDMLWIAEHLAPHFDADGKLSEYEGVVVNITDRKRAESERNLAYALVRDSINAVSDLMAVCDLEGNVIMANAAYERVRPPRDGLHSAVRFAEDRDGVVERFLAGVNTCPSGQGEAVRGLCRLEDSDVWLDVGISRYLAPEGEVVGAVLIMRPLTRDV